MFNVFSVVKILSYLGIVIIVAGGLWYAMNLKAELATSEANNKILEISLSDLSAVIEQMRVDIAQIQRINEEVNAEIGRQREEVNNLISQLVKKKDVEPGELYILARQLKNIDEFMLSRELYKEIYNRFGNDLDGEVVAEYAQVLFMSSGREFSDTIYILLEEALKKNPNNPSALTLKGLAELEKSNPQMTIELWNQAIPLLNSEKEKDDLRSLIEAVKKRKNQ